MGLGEANSLALLYNFLMGTEDPLNLPQWDDLLVGLVRWAGAPFAVVLLVYVFLWVLSWLQAGTSAYRHGRTATRAVINAVATHTTKRGRSRFTLFVVSALFALGFVSVVRLTLNYWGRSGSPYWDDWAWIGVLVSWDTDTVWYLTAVAASITLLGIAHIRGATVLAIAIAVVWVPLLVISGLLGIFWGVAFVGNALLATLKALTHDDDPNYTFSTASNFFVLASTGIATAWLGPIVWERISAVFGWLPKKAKGAPASTASATIKPSYVTPTTKAPPVNSSSPEPTSFNVFLESVGSSHIQTIKAVRTLTDLGLAEAKALVDTAPSLVLSGVSRANADSARAELERAGASASVRYSN